MSKKFKIHSFCYTRSLCNVNGFIWDLLAVIKSFLHWERLIQFKLILCILSDNGDIAYQSLISLSQIFKLNFKKDVKQNSYANTGTMKL